MCWCVCGGFVQSCYAVSIPGLSTKSKTRYDHERVFRCAPVTCVSIQYAMSHDGFPLRLPQAHVRRVHKYLQRHTTH
jgi:hypothetical protein